MRIDVVFHDRVGIAHEILAVLAERRLNVTAVEVAPPHVFVDAPDLAEEAWVDLREALLAVAGTRSAARVDILPGSRDRLHLEALLSAMADPVLDDWLSRRPDGTAVTVSALRRSFHAPDAAGTMPAPVSYVVRYLLPADDAAAFRRAYLAGLVPIQARLPGIRSILCYVLLADAAGRWPAMDYLIGNEVAFDSVDAFNAAMRSPARDELRTQSGTLPAYSGNGSHVLMRRERLFTAGRD